MFVFNHLIPDVQLDGKTNKRNFSSHDTHKRIYFYFPSTSHNPPNLRFQFSMRNSQCFRFIFYRNWKIPVWIHPPSLCSFIDIDQYRVAQKMIKTFLHTRIERLVTHDDVHRSHGKLIKKQVIWTRQKQKQRKLFR